MKDKDTPQNSPLKKHQKTYFQLDIPTRNTSPKHINSPCNSILKTHTTYEKNGPKIKMDIFPRMACGLQLAHERCSTSWITVVEQSLSLVQLFVTPDMAAHQAPVSSTISRNYSYSCQLSQLCYITILSRAAHFSFCFQSFPTSGSFHWVSSLHQVAKVLELQHQSFQWISRIDFL